MRLIDGDAIIEEYCGDCAYRGTELCEDNVPACGTAGWIKDAPTVDAVEVVRCKDCKWFGKMDELDACNRIYGFTIAPIMPDHYCGYGERKTT